MASPASPSSWPPQRNGRGRGVPDEQVDSVPRRLAWECPPQSDDAPRRDACNGLRRRRRPRISQGSWGHGQLLQSRLPPTFPTAFVAFTDQDDGGTGTNCPGSYSCAPKACVVSQCHSSRAYRVGERRLTANLAAARGTSCLRRSRESGSTYLLLLPDAHVRSPGGPRLDYSEIGVTTEARGGALQARACCRRARNRR